MLKFIVINSIIKRRVIKFCSLKQKQRIHCVLKLNEKLRRNEKEDVVNTKWKVNYKTSENSS